MPGSALALGPVLSFGSAASESGQLSSPGGVAIGPDGAVYVVDTGAGKVNVYSPLGVYLRSLGKKAVPTGGGGDCDKNEDDQHCKGDDGTGAAGVLRSPRDVVVDAGGNVYVADTGNSRIDVFAPDGSFVRAFGKGVNPAGGDVCTEATGCKRGSGNPVRGGLSSPLGIGIDSAGLLYVTGSFYIDVFSSSGSYVRSVGRESTTSETTGGKDCSDENNGHCNTREFEVAGAINAPYDVAIAPDGKLAVADYGNDRVDIFAPDGSFVRAFGKGVNPAGGDVCTEATGCQKGASGTAGGALAYPAALAWSGSESLYVAESANNRVDQFNADGAFVRAFGEGVTSGASEFQVCAAAPSCRAGLVSVRSGSVAGPRGIAVDCAGGIFATEWGQGSEKSDSNQGGAVPARVERFAEPDTQVPPCAPAAPTGSDRSGSSTASAGAGDGSSSRHAHKVPKPLISVVLNKAAGTATLIVVVSDQGTLVLKGKGVRKATQEVKRPGEFELQVNPVGKARRALLESGKAKVKVSLAFRAQGEAVVQAKAIVLKKVGSF